MVQESDKEEIIEPGKLGGFKKLHCGLFIRDYLLQKENKEANISEIHKAYKDETGQRMKYSSFTAYFQVLKLLGWVEPTGRTEDSIPQQWSEEFSPKVYYKLTDKGESSTEDEWKNPYERWSTIK